MEKCKPWAVAAVYLMQSAGGREHYTDIVNYLLDTELTELTEKGVATSRTITQKLNQTVINGRAIFNTDGNGYYSLSNPAAIRNNEEIQGVVQSLNNKNLKVNLLTLESKEEEKMPMRENDILDCEDDKLNEDARKLSDETLRLSDVARKLSDETRRLSDEAIKLTDENKKLRDENRTLREKIHLLADETEELNKEVKRLMEGNQQLKEKLRSIKQLCE